MEDDAEAGIFTWSIAENALYADTAVAALFGLDPMSTLLGLPPVDYLTRVHQADRDGVVKLWLWAVADGLPYSAVYRVMDGAGTIRQGWRTADVFAIAQAVPPISPASSTRSRLQLRTDTTT